MMTNCTLIEALAPKIIIPNKRKSKSPTDAREEVFSSQPYYTKPLEWDSTSRKWVPPEQLQRALHGMRSSS
jgi:hypothetical protein